MSYITRLCALVFVLFVSGWVSATILHTYDFEVNEILDYDVVTSGNAPTISTGTIAACNGSKVMSVYLHRENSPTKYRTEMARLADAWPDPGSNLPLFTTQMISFMVYVPTSNANDIGDDRQDLIMQLHPGEDDNLAGTTAYINSRNPIFHIEIDGTDWKARVAGDDAELTNKSSIDRSASHNYGAVTKGVWVNWQIQVRVDYRATGSGFIKVWKDGVLGLDYTGQVGFADSHGPYMKIGLYKPVWKSSRINDTAVNERNFYFDDIKIGDASETQASTDTTCNGTSPAGQASAPTAVSSTQSGQSVVVSWTPPTMYFGGGSIDSAITGYDVRYATTPEGAELAIAARGLPVSTSYTAYPDDTGQKCYQVRAVTNGVAGYWSDFACVDYTSGSTSGNPLSGDPQLQRAVYNSITGGTISSLDITSDTAIPDGHLVLMCGAVPKNKTLATPAGFTASTTVTGTHATDRKAPKLQCFTKIASSEPLTHTMAMTSGTEERITGFKLTFANPDGSPIADSDVIEGLATNSATLPALTGGTANNTIVAIGMFWEDPGTLPTVTAPTGYTEVINDGEIQFSRYSTTTVSYKKSTDGTAASAAFTASTSDANAVGIHYLIKGGTVVSDTTPDAFTFADVTNAQLSIDTVGCIYLTGTDAATDISITGGAYSINSTSYTATSGSVPPDAEVCAKVTSSASHNTAVDAVLTIGGVSDTFSVTTILPHKIKFTGADTGKVLANLAGVNYTGVLDYFMLWDADPREDANANLLVYLNDVSISAGVLEFDETDISTVAGSTGSINALTPGTYWYSTKSEDGVLKSVRQISVVAE